MRLEQRLRSLTPDPERPVFQLVDAAHPLRFYIGRQMTGEFSLLLVDDERPPSLPRLASLKIESIERGGGDWGILITLEDAALLPLFGALCDDLLASTSLVARGAPGSTLVARRIQGWRRLLDRGGASLLGPEELRGLFGELCVLEWMISQLGPNGVKSWVGPEGAHQDFELGSRCVEVKTVRPAAEHVRIASEHQLYAGSRALKLAVVEVTDATDGGVTLNQLVAKIRGVLSSSAEAEELFDSRMREAGYLARPEYDTPQLKWTGTNVFAVREGFPRLTPRDLPGGVREATYLLSLASCAAFLTPGGIQEILIGA